mgnify:CR=1 FL=1
MSAGFSWLLWAETYPDQTKVNLIRHCDPRTGSLTTTITGGWGNFIDGGYTGGQVGPASGAPLNFDITLSAVRMASKLIVEYTGYWPETWSIYYSDTGFTGMTLLASNGYSTVDHREYAFPGGADGTPVRYLRFLQTTRISPADYIRMNEVLLMGATNNAMDDADDGFNLLVNRSALGASPYTKNPGNSDDPANVLDLNPISGYMRPLGTAPYYFVIPLTNAYTLRAMNFGFYDGWGSAEVHVSAAESMPDVTQETGWTLVHTNSPQSTQFVKFTNAVPTRWMRIRYSGGNALSEIELFAQPIPAGTAVVVW